MVGSNFVATNPVRVLIEDLIVIHDLEMVNVRHSPPILTSDIGDSTWIDVTLATRGLALSIDSCFVDSAFSTSSDNRPIFLTIDGVPLSMEFFRRNTWDRVQWLDFVATVAYGCEEAGLTISIESGLVTISL